MILNTGQPRSILGNAISAGVASFICASENKQNTLENTAQIALATACGIGAANALGEPNGSFSNLLKAGSFVLLGFAGIYAIKQIAKKEQTKIAQIPQNTQISQISQISQEGEQNGKKQK